MKPKLLLIASIAIIGCFAASHPRDGFSVIAPAHAECDPGTPIDKTTVDTARDHAIKAGYKNPLHLKKGCDNTWHGTATLNGEQVNVAVLPDGHVVRDGD